MGTRAQVDIRQGKKVVHLYAQFDGCPSNIVPLLEDAAEARLSGATKIAKEIARLEPGFLTIKPKEYLDSQSVNYHYVVDVASKPWQVEETTEAYVDLP